MDFAKKFALLMFGLFLFGVGILLAIHSQLGASPWDTFHVGIANRTPLSLGQVSQILGVVIILIDIAMKQMPGRATILNMYFVGYFVDLLEGHSLIPNVQNLFGKVVMLLLGIVAVGWGTFFYLNAGWGAGPRDGLMLGLSRLLSTKVWKARTAIEVCVALAGLALGAKLGLGTVAVALLVGPAVQIAYRIGGIDPKAIVHRTLADDYRALVSRTRHSQEGRVRSQ
ncbi:MAG: YczE/YyaS/YitT family protein [Bacillota bacterium]